MECELCGREATLVPVSVGGSKLSVCGKCTRFGTVLTTRTLTSKHTSSFAPDLNELASDFSSRIRKARQKKGWDQEELARKIFEKKSVILKLENGHLTPSERLVKKLQKALGISLSGSKSSDEETPVVRPRGPVTMADLIDFKK